MVNGNHYPTMLTNYVSPESEAHGLGELILVRDPDDITKWGPLRKLPDIESKNAHSKDLNWHRHVDLTKFRVSKYFSATKLANFY